jgi:phosphate transport system substrate-binding protein
VAACAEEFMTRHPQADIVVKGGGSGDGIAAVLHGIVDIGMASRDISRRERDYAASRNIELAVSALALDGVAIVVHRGVAVPPLDLQQVRDISTGRIRNWRELGGAPADILAFGRAEGSGTAALFGERVMQEDGYAPSVSRLASNEAIVAEVAARPGAIGYTGLGALRAAGDRITALALRADAQSEAIAPVEEAIRSSKYPLARTLHLATAGKPSGIANAFIDFCTAAGGQALVQRAGYVAIGARTR